MQLEVEKLVTENREQDAYVVGCKPSELHDIVHSKKTSQHK